MPNVEDIFKQLNEGQDVKVLRTAIVDLIEHHLQTLKRPLEYWQKAQLHDATHEIEWNIDSKPQQPKASITLCLHILRDVLAPEKHRNDNFTARDQQIEALTHEQLIERIKSLRQKGC